MTQFNDLNIYKITLLDLDLKNLEIYATRNEFNGLNFENYKLLSKKYLNKRMMENRKKNRI